MGRYFVAVRPPEHALDQIGRVPRPTVDGVRWTKRDQWHVTLAFLGDVDESAIVSSLEQVEFSTARARLGPEVEMIRSDVVVIPVGGLDDLARAVRSAVLSEVSGLSERGFLGHLTLGRSRSGVVREVVGHPVDVRFDVEQFVLVRSELDSRGARHFTVAGFALGREAGAT